MNQLTLRPWGEPCPFGGPAIGGSTIGTRNSV